MAQVELENAGTVGWRDGDQARLPLARRSRQPDRLGRRADCAAAPRTRRAGDGRRRASGHRSRPGATASRSTSSPSCARGSPSSAASELQHDDRGARRAPAPRAPSFPAGSSRAPAGRSASTRRTPRGTRSSPARSTGAAASSAAAACARTVRAGPRTDPRLLARAPLPVGRRGAHARAPARRRRAAGLRRALESPGSTTAASCSARIHATAELQLDRDPVVDPAEDAAQPSDECERRRRPRGRRRRRHAARGRARARRAPRRSAARRSCPTREPRAARGGLARSAGRSAKLQRIGVRKNHGSRAAARMCSTSRKSDVQARDDQRHAGDEPYEEQRQREGEPHRRASGRDERRARGRSGSRASRANVTSLRRDDRERDELPREAHLLDQFRAVDQRARACLQRVAKKIQHASPASR